MRMGYLAILGASIHRTRCAEEFDGEIGEVTPTQRPLHHPQRASW